MVRDSPQARDRSPSDIERAARCARSETPTSSAKRSDELWRQRIVTALEYERDRAALASAQATVDGLKTRLGYAVIKAPISGVITEKRLEAGDIVSPQTRLFSVAPQARSRLNTAFVTCNFIAGAMGSGLCGTLWESHGWAGVMAGAGALTTLALLVWVWQRGPLLQASVAQRRKA
jgi:multidrug efflux pump subunit AcrA (membrane-fusion protein)